MKKTRSHAAHVFTFRMRTRNRDVNRSNPMIQTRAHTERVSVGKVNHKFECAEILLSGASLGGMFGAVLLVFPIDVLQNTQVFFIVV